jgi:hypothetical protein
LWWGRWDVDPRYRGFIIETLAITSVNVVGKIVRNLNHADDKTQGLT